MITQPPYLKKGDTIGIVCPAGYMAIEKIQTCINTLQQWGYKVKTGNTVGSHSNNYFAGTDEERLLDLQQMLDDDSINAIMCARGGYGIGKIIDHLNFKKFKKKPKWIIGYSDVTILLNKIYNYKIAGLHSPMAGAFNNEGYKNEFVGSLKNALQGKKANYTATPHFLNKKGKAAAALVGGNLTLLVNGIGTSTDINTNNKILFIEDIGEYLYSTDRMFNQLQRSGKLNKLAALIIGGFTDMKDTERPFGKTIYEIIHDVVANYNYPVCFNFPVSHSDENYALKIGVKYVLNIAKDKVTLKEQ
jgi:muramoyltetrapeptide carboxypeptidase